MLELTAVIKGNVQGVGFRATAKLFADRSKLTGFVRNLPDGTVELCAQGEKLQLEKLLAELKREFSSYIGEIASNFHPPAKSYPDFKISR
jgi:acylphosphatase